MSARSDFSSASASARASAAPRPPPRRPSRRAPADRRGAAQTLDAAQLALGVGQLAGDLLGVALVVPQVRIGRLVLELLDLGAQAVHVEHPFHRGQGGVKGGDVRLSIEVHGRLTLPAPSRVGTGGGFPGSPRRLRVQHHTCAAPGTTGSSRMRPYYVAIVGAGPPGSSPQPRC